MRKGSMALDGPIRANRFADSRESLDSCESLQGSQTEPPFLRITLRGGRLKIAKISFEAIRSKRSTVMKKGISLRIDSRESIRATRPESRCEPQGHLIHGTSSTCLMPAARFPLTDTRYFHG